MFARCIWHRAARGKDTYMAQSHTRKGHIHGTEPHSERTHTWHRATLGKDTYMAQSHTQKGHIHGTEPHSQRTHTWHRGILRYVATTYRDTVGPVSWDVI